MILTMLRRSFSEGRQRKILAGATVALAATLVTALFLLSVDVGDKMAQEMTSYGSNIEVEPKADSVSLVIGGVDYNPLRGRSYLDEKDLPKIKTIFWRNNIRGMMPHLSLPVTLAPLDREGTRNVSLIGTYFDHPMPVPGENGYRTGALAIAQFWNIEGGWPADNSENVLIGRRLAGRVHLRVGDTLRLLPPAAPAGHRGEARQVQVRGIVTTGGEEDDAIVAPLALAQDLAGLPGKVASVEVSALTVPENALSRKAQLGVDQLSSEEYDKWYCTAYVSSISHQITEALPDASAHPVWRVASGQGVVVQRIQALLLAVSIAAIVAAAMCVSALMNATVMERAQEIGLLKALGAARWEVYLLFIGEAILVGIAGGGIGLVLGYGVAQGVGWSVFDSVIAFRTVAVPVVLVVSSVTVLIGSILPARAIARLLPAEVLHGRR